ncbi:hypothetical protein EZS27_013471 [termite gut metagenome]|uniref:Uncharacterized protein n=1 Tax=termite gut metagenome TaxID=433724 RepID=A0A5J4RX56_9ZZZZ
MGLFNFFRRNKAKESDLPEIKKEDFADDSNLSDKNNVITITYGTGKPIDLIYSYLEEDYESKGYNDALCNPDNSYKEMNKKWIKSGLEVKLKRVILIYGDKLSEIDFHIKSRAEAGLIDIVKDLESKKDILEKHVDTLAQMENEIQDDNVFYISRMLTSYERGFLRGLAALSLETVKIKQL